MSIVIAVDGTAASGKGTLAKKLASRFNYAHLDSGALYRLTALAVLETNHNPNSERDALSAVHSLNLDRIADRAIRTAEVGRASAIVAAIPSVRKELLEFQRNFASHPPEGRLGCVIDGRDIGTVVFPGADVKLFVDAAIGVRARRRFLELRAHGADATEEDVLNDLIARDTADRTRKISPLVHAPDAILIDTTTLSVSAMCETVIEEVEKRLSGKRKQMELPFSE